MFAELAAGHPCQTRPELKYKQNCMKLRISGAAGGRKTGNNKSAWLTFVTASCRSRKHGSCRSRSQQQWTISPLPHRCVSLHTVRNLD